MDSCDGLVQLTTVVGEVGNGNVGNKCAREVNAKMASAAEKYPDVFV